MQACHSCFVFRFVFFFRLTRFSSSHFSVVWLLISSHSSTRKIYVNLRVIRRHKCQLKANNDIYNTETSHLDLIDEKRQRVKNIKPQQRWLTYTLRQYIHIASRSPSCNEWGKWSRTHFRDKNPGIGETKQKKKIVWTLKCKRKKEKKIYISDALKWTSHRSAVHFCLAIYFPKEFLPCIVYVVALLSSLLTGVTKCYWFGGGKCFVIWLQWELLCGYSLTTVTGYSCRLL